MARPSGYFKTTSAQLSEVAKGPDMMQETMRHAMTIASQATAASGYAYTADVRAGKFRAVARAKTSSNEAFFAEQQNHYLWRVKRGRTMH